MDNQVIKEYCNVIKRKVSESDYAGAINIAEQLIYNFPNDFHGYYYKAICCFAYERYPEAINFYNITINLNPNYPRAYFNLATTYHKIKYYDLALVNFGKALILFSNKGDKSGKERCIEALQIVQSERV